MEYTIARLARLSGVTARTLRYYDQIGLLRPVRISNGYRIYGQKEVDRLQTILLYRELGMELKDIAVLLNDPAFDRSAALEGHLAALLQRRNQLDQLIGSVKKTISALKGETAMSDKEKFEGFKDSMIADNEARYGAEIRKKYGDKTVDAANAKVKGMSEEKLHQAEALRQRMDGLLRQAIEAGDPGSELAQEACSLHRQWLCLYWPEGMYSKAAHRGLGEMYVADERFTAYYEKIAPGCASFLRDALNIYCAE